MRYLISIGFTQQKYLVHVKQVHACRDPKHQTVRHHCNFNPVNCTQPIKSGYVALYYHSISHLSGVDLLIINARKFIFSNPNCSFLKTLPPYSLQLKAICKRLHRCALYQCFRNNSCLQLIRPVTFAALAPRYPCEELACS